MAKRKVAVEIPVVAADKNHGEESWMDDILADAEAEEATEEAQAAQPVTSEQLMSLAEELVGVEAERARLEAELKQINDRRSQLRVQLIPDAMKELKMVNSKGKGSFTSAGHRIHLEQKLYASCSEAGKPLLFDHLRKSGDTHMIKETVNAQTLSAYIRERRAEGLNDPPGVSVHEEVTAKLTKVR